MANRPYLRGMYHWLNGDLNWLTDNIKVVLCSSAYTPSTISGGDEFLSVIPGGAIVATSGNLGTKSITTPDGVVRAANPTISGVTGSTVTQFVIYNDTGAAGTSQLIALYDTATNLPLIPNGGNVIIQWAGAPNYIFALYKGLSERERGMLGHFADWLRDVCGIPAERSPGGIWLPTPTVVQHGF